jgi:hypothetical protein
MHKASLAQTVLASFPTLGVLFATIEPPHEKALRASYRF